MVCYDYEVSVSAGTQVRTEVGSGDAQPTRFTYGAISYRLEHELGKYLPEGQFVIREGADNNRSEERRRERVCSTV